MISIAALSLRPNLPSVCASSPRLIVARRAGVSRLNSISKMNFAGLGAWLIRKVMRDKRVEEAAQLLKNLQEGGAQLIACQMSMDVMGIRHEELIDGVELGGVAAFLSEAQQSATTLFI